MNKDPYKVLELPEEATFQQIKDRYRHLSKFLHPDKQPLQNYLMAQQNFKQIDEAYKSISSPLRRYIYHKFGYAGIRVLEGCPYDFKIYENANLDDPRIQNQLHQLVYYFLLQQHAAIEQDKNKLKTRTIMIMFRPLNHINRPPILEKNQFQFQTSLPQFQGMTHTLSIIQTTQNISGNQIKPNMMFNLNSTKRLNETVMLNFHSLFSHDKFSIEGGIDKVINSNFVLHFNPLHLDDGTFGPPQFGADYHRGKFYASAVTDIQHVTLQFGLSPQNKEYNKMIKISFDNENFLIGPGFEKDVTSTLRIFAHVQAQVQKVSDSEIGASFGLNYGYRLKLLQEMKLQLSSFIGVQSNFQISIMTPKFKVTIPIFAKTDNLSYEWKKIVVFMATYIFFQGYHKWKQLESSNRKREEFQNYNRLSVDKNTLLKYNAEVSVSAKESRQKQLNYKGLVILFAYMGSYQSIKAAKKRINKKFNQNNPILFIDEATQQNIQTLKQSISTNVDSFQNQLFDITDIVQASVSGAHLINFRLDKYGVNPCLNEKSTYWSLITYWRRGQLRTKVQKGSQSINIGQLKKKYNKSWWSSIKSYVQNILHD